MGDLLVQWPEHASSWISDAQGFAALRSPGRKPTGNLWGTAVSLAQWPGLKVSIASGTMGVGPGAGVRPTNRCHLSISVLSQPQGVEASPAATIHCAFW